MKNPALPCLPLLCLQTACETSTSEVCKGKNTVIDFWTTKCTRCPAALDAMNDRARSPHNRNIQFVSICCDKCDGAREILEQSDEPRWSAIGHYYMEERDKERAKSVLGFTSVPFYVVLNEQGDVVQLGNKIDWDSLPGSVAVKDENDGGHGNLRGPSPAASSSMTPGSMVIDDLDF